MAVIVLCSFLGQHFYLFDIWILLSFPVSGRSKHDAVLPPLSPVKSMGDAESRSTPQGRSEGQQLSPNKKPTLKVGILLDSATIFCSFCKSILYV